ncbi:MAG: cupin domain-containing protein [Chloroflexota bacterium]
MRPVPVGLIARAALALALSAAPVPALAADPSPDPVGIQRASLGDVLPDSAPGLRLGLWEVVIPAHSVAPPHVHLGYQIVNVTEGTLTYHIISGEAEVHRADGTTEQKTTGDQFELGTGDWLVEAPGMEHEAWNAGDTEVRNLSATLMPDGVGISIPLKVDSAAPSFAP